MGIKQTILLEGMERRTTRSTIIIETHQIYFQNHGGRKVLNVVKFVNFLSRSVFEELAYTSFILFLNRVKASYLNLFDDSNYENLKSISEVLDRVCICKSEDKDNKNATYKIECNYGTYQNCKFVVGKPYRCILNPEGQLRRKRDVRRLELMFFKSHDVELAVSSFLLELPAINVTRFK